METINRINVNGTGKKLLTYKLFKSDFCTETYVKQAVLRLHRIVLAKFRCGVAPLRVETSRYEQLEVNQMVCFHCIDNVEDESHVIWNCPLYDDIRNTLFNSAKSPSANFDSFNYVEKLCFLLSSSYVFRQCAKACYDILCVDEAYYMDE
jgi:hypothetical protein